MSLGYEQMVPTTTVLAVSVPAGLLDDVGAHEQVVEVEVGRAGLVGADAADPGGQVDDEVGPEVVEHGRDVVGAAQVVLLTGRRNDIVRAACSSAGAHGPAKEPGTTSDEHSQSRPELGVAHGGSLTVQHCPVVRVGINLLWLVPGVVGGSEEQTTGLLGAIAEVPAARHRDHPVRPPPLCRGVSRAWRCVPHRGMPPRRAAQGPTRRGRVHVARGAREAAWARPASPRRRHHPAGADSPVALDHP